MKRIDQYESVKDTIDKIHIQDLSGYQAGKLLYASVWGMYDLSLWQKIKRVLAILICNPIKMSAFADSADGADIALEIVYPGNVWRADNAAIFNNIYEYLKPCRHVLLEKKYKINLLGIPRRLVRLCRYIYAIKGFSLPERLYLAAQLVLAKDLAELFDREDFFKESRYLLIFQEYDTISSLAIQNAHHYGVKVISPQHGMVMNRHENIDQLCFDGFLCDYKLVWNDFEREQYISAGIDPKRIFVVGNTKELGQEKAKSSSREADPFIVEAPCFGVVLNCPKNDGAYRVNRMLLNFANALSNENGMRYLVKLHPTDTAEGYGDYIDPERGKFAAAGMTMAEYRGEVLFSLVNVSGAIFDLIYDGRFVFQYVGDERYPIDMDDIYMFHTEEELIDHYRRWKADYAHYCKAYQTTVNKYLVTNARERHDQFFEELFAGELE